MDTKKTQEFLAELEKLTADGFLSDGQFEAIGDKYSAEISAQPEASAKISAMNRATAALLSVGVVVIVLAIIFLISMSWIFMSSVVRALVVGGFMIASYTAAFLIFYRTTLKKTAAAVMVLASLLLPLFLYVVVFEFDFAAGLGEYGGALFISSITSIAAICVAYLIKNKALALVYAISLTVFYGAGLAELRSLDIGFFGLGNATQWLPLAILFLAAGLIHQFAKNQSYANVLYIIGSIILIGASMNAADSVRYENLWQAVIIVECGLLVGLSIPLKSRTLLVVGILATIIDVIQLYVRYFTEVLWWPIGMSIFGILLIVLAIFIERGRVHIRSAIGSWR